ALTSAQIIVAGAAVQRVVAVAAHQEIVVIAAVERVAAAATSLDVVARKTVDRVVARCADKAVVTGSAVDICHVRSPVASRIQRGCYGSGRRLTSPPSECRQRNNDQSNGQIAPVNDALAFRRF